MASNLDAWTPRQWIQVIFSGKAQALLIGLGKEVPRAQSKEYHTGLVSQIFRAAINKLT